MDLPPKARLSDSHPGFAAALILRNGKLRVAEIVPKMLHDAGCRRLAYVVLGGSESLQALKFGETVAVNRGQVTRVFGDERSAIGWLLEGVEFGVAR